MYFYRIGYAGHDAWDAAMLAHNEQWTRGAYDKLIHDLVVEVVPSHLRRHEEMANDIHVGTFFDRVRMSDVYEDVARLMVERHGFTFVDFALSFIPNDEDLLSPEECDDLCLPIAESVVAAGYNRDRYPLFDQRPIKKWSDLSDATRATWAELGYDEGSFDDAADPSIPG